jgi:glutamate-1-semialdehyde 2,1-aminomutase
MLVYDEVVTGFRVAWGGATQLYGVTPDLVAYGKIVGGGYPLAAVAGRREVLGLSNPRAKGPGYTYISGTLNGNPLAAAAGLATLEELEKPGAYEKLNALGARLRSGLLAAAATAGLPAQVLGVGPMANIYFTSSQIRDYRDAQTEDRGLKQRLQRALLDGGHLTNPWAKLYLSTAHDEADVDATVAAAKDALARG